METLGHVYAYRCMRTHAQALHMHAYTYTSMHMHAKVPETMRNKFYAFNFGFWKDPTSFESHSKPPFSNYKKPYIVHFQRTENPKEKHKIH